MSLEKEWVCDALDFTVVSRKKEKNRICHGKGFRKKILHFWGAS